MPRWWNWYTRMLEVHMPQGVEVQVLSWAPLERLGFLPGFSNGLRTWRPFEIFYERSENKISKRCTEHASKAFLNGIRIMKENEFTFRYSFVQVMFKSSPEHKSDKNDLNNFRSFLLRWDGRHLDRRSKDICKSNIGVSGEPDRHGHRCLFRKV